MDSVILEGKRSSLPRQIRRLVDSFLIFERTEIQLAFGRHLSYYRLNRNYSKCSPIQIARSNCLEGRRTYEGYLMYRFCIHETNYGVVEVAQVAYFEIFTLRWFHHQEDPFPSVWELFSGSAIPQFLSTCRFIGSDADFYLLNPKEG